MKQGNITDKFKSFVSIDLNDYNELILKNKEQEEMIVAQAEEIERKEKETIEIESHKEFYQELFYQSIINFVFLNDKHKIIHMVNNNSDYWKDNIYRLMDNLCKDKTQQDIIYSIIFEMVKKEQQENENGN